MNLVLIILGTIFIAVAVLVFTESPGGSIVVAALGIACILLGQSRREKSKHQRRR